MENHTADEAAIRAAILSIETAWNDGNGTAFAAPFADDADYVVVNGLFLQGRAAIADGHQMIFDTIYRGSRNAATVRDVRWLRDDVAVAHVEWHLRFWQDGNPRENHAINTLVLTNTAGAWQIAAFQNTPVTMTAQPTHRTAPMS